MDVSLSLEYRTREEDDLANLYANQHERLDNFIFMYAIPSQLFRRYGVELYSSLGYLLLFGLFFLIIFVPGLIITAATAWWVGMPPLRLALIAASLAFLNVLALIGAQVPAYKISALHRFLRDSDQIRKLMVWDRKWFGPRRSLLMGGSIGLAFLVVLYLLNYLVIGIHLPAIVLWICAVIAVFLGQFSFSTSMIFFEFKKLSTCRFDLYRLNPFDTFALQKTSRGLKQLGMVSTFSLPCFLLVLLFVLPQGSALNIPITAGFLLLTYVAVVIGILFPLGFLGTIVKNEKWRLLTPIQTDLNQIAEGLPNLSNSDYRHYVQLQSIYQTLHDTKESFLSLGALARIGGALLLSTTTVLLTSVVQAYLQKLI